MTYQKYIKILLLFLGLFMAKSVLAADFWVSDPDDCPTEAFSQSCVNGEQVCGVNPSNVVSCYDLNSFTPPVAGTASSGTAKATGGYYLNCYAYDSAAPFCDNNGGSISGAYACFQQQTCYDKRLVTNCTADAWATSTCSTTCLAGYRDCNSDGDCSDGDERDGASCTTAGGLPGTYSNCVCNATSATLKLSYDSAIGTYLKNSALLVPALTINSSGFMMIGSTSTPSTFLSFPNLTGDLINMSGGLISNLSDPVQNQDAATKAYVDSTIPNLVNPIIASSSIWQLLGSNTYYNGGNVGIGTTTPEAKLALIGNMVIRSSNGLKIYDSSGYGGAVINSSYRFSNGEMFIKPAGATISTLFSPNNGVAVGIDAAPPANGLIVGGNVGIGTTAPSKPLTVKSPAGEYTPLRLEWTNTPGGSAASLNIDSIWNDRVRINPVSTGSENGTLVLLGNSNQQLQLVDANRTIGMGNYGFDFRPNVNTSAAVRITSGSSDGTKPVFIVQGYYNAASQTGDLQRWVDRLGSTQAVFSALGNFGIGTANPNYKLSFPAVTDKLVDLGGGRIGNLSSPVSPTDAANKAYVDDLTAGTGAKYVTSTPDYYTGDQGGYRSANALCNAVASSSHVCTNSEILDTLNKTTINLPNPATLWISSGPPGDQVNTNDCLGWTSSEVTNFGTVWMTNSSVPDGVGSVQRCTAPNGGPGGTTTGYRFACCK